MYYKSEAGTIILKKLKTKATNKYNHLLDRQNLIKYLFNIIILYLNTSLKHEKNLYIFTNNTDNKHEISRRKLL